MIADVQFWVEHAVFPQGWTHDVRAQVSAGRSSAITAGAAPALGGAAGAIAAVWRAGAQVVEHVRHRQRQAITVCYSKVLAKALQA